jgi:hypothetical protein
MKITLELPESDLREICQLTGIRKKGPAIRKVLDDVLRLGRRAEISQKFMSGEWPAELDTFEAARAADRISDQNLAELWRD